MTTETKPTMSVVFLAFKEDGEVIALLCGTEEDCNPGCIMSYMHVGQHGEADSDLARDPKLRPATPEEYAPLAHELASIYNEHNIVPVQA